MPRIWKWDDPTDTVRDYLASDRIVAVPTESSYGLAVRPESSVGVAAVLAVKSRPSGEPLPVVAGTVAELVGLGARLDDPLLASAIAAWPAPLTVVAPLRRPIAAACGETTLAVRVPAHRRLVDLLSSLGTAVTATSANRSGEPALSRVEEVVGLLRGVDALVIDDGELPGGPPSTLVAVREGRLVVLREGRYPSKMLVRSS